MSKARIVVIEDQEEVRENLVETLELAGYEVADAPDGHSGVLLVRSFQPQLVLCDVMMPKLDGFGVLELLRGQAATASIPFVFLSARTEREDLRRGMNLGAADYVTKPFFQDELLRVVQLRIAQSTASTNDGPVLATAQSQPPPTGVGNGITMQDDAASRQRVQQVFQELRGCGRLRHFTDRSPIYFEGDEAREVYFVRDGRLRSHRETSFGKSLTLDFYGTGSWVGIDDLLGGGLHASSVSAFPQASLIIVPRAELLSVLQHHPELVLALARQFAQDAALRSEQLLQIAYFSVRKRVAESLLRFAGGPARNVVELRREDIADAIGTTPESVTRTLTELRRDGLVDLPTAGEIILLNRQGLEELPA